MNDTDDANPYRDDTSGVGGTTGSVYQTSPQPNGKVAQVYYHLADGLRIIGQGRPTVVAYGEDNVTSQTVSGVPMLSATPGREYYIQYNLTAERASLKFTITGVDNYMILSAQRHEFQKWVSRR
jgi:hypothetical protein